MIVHNFDPVFIDLGFLQIRWYSIAFIVGIILGWIYAIKIIKEMAKKHNFTIIKQTVFDDLIIYLVIGIVLGGRLGYVIFYNFEYYSKNIFRPGFSSKEQGWGLGLSLTSRIIKEIHGGSIRVAKSKIGDGTTIEITLPQPN